MAIDRGPWNALIDDDGSNLVGSVWNKAAIKTVLLDPTDAAIAAVPATLPTYGTMTPVDGSGAGLVFGYAAGKYSRFDKLVFFWLQVVYPTTSNGALAAIGGLPFPVAANGGASQGYGPLSMWYFQTTAGANLDVRPQDPTTGIGRANSQMSGVNVVLTGTYLTT